MPVLSRKDRRQIRVSLLAWYDAHQRDLPWRKDRNPYRVWVSEVMLQQTRVAAVLDHYERFMKRFPTVQSLAAAHEPTVLAMWSGLGYYHRARRMHEAAKIIVRERNGAFPATAEEWKMLPGIGRYTAAAVASIACGEVVAVVDGNVERVLQRQRGREFPEEAIWQQATALLDQERPGDFNQAIMELGATICTPRVPQCLLCPLMKWCKTRGAEPKRNPAARQRGQLTYALAKKHGAVLLVQRPAGARLMPGMWQLPELGPEALNGDNPIAEFQHSITNTDYEVLVYEKLAAVEASQLKNASLDYARQKRSRSARDQSELLVKTRWCTRRQWAGMPLTGLTRKILRKLEAES